MEKIKEVYSKDQIALLYKLKHTDLYVLDAKYSKNVLTCKKWEEIFKKEGIIFSK